MHYKYLSLTLLATLVFFVSYHAWARTLDTPTPEPSAQTPEDVSQALLPDLVPLPARDLTLERGAGGALLLRFSTTYFNQGQGPLELRADPETAGIAEDIERQVFQRVYLPEDAYEDTLVGTFLWHQEHLHYHFTDFIEYDLAAAGAPAQETLSGSLVKSTFCLRDISTVELDLPNRKEEAVYTICGKELQGVSVGWGDTYYYNYPDQSLDISSLASGTYHLVQRVNAEQRLRESSYDNNVSTTLFRLDRENETIEVIAETPLDAPEVNHVYLDDPFGI